jgi:SAM-dependent methyltransferase
VKWPRPTTVAWLGAAATLAANGVRYRRRVQALPVLEPVGGAGAPGFTTVSAAGAKVDDATVRAAVTLAAERGFDVVDLVPGDLPSARLLDLVRWLDPRTYADRPMALGRTAAHAMVASDDVLRRSGVTRTTGLGAAEMDRLAVALRRHAPFTSTVVLVPWLRSSVVARRELWPRHTATYLGAAGDAVAARAAGLGALTAAALRHRPAGLAALAAYQAQAVVATAGTAARPRDLASTGALRPLLAALDVAAAAFGGVAHLRRPDPEVAALRADYGRQLSEAEAGAYLEPRRLDCRLCGSADLRPHLEVHDLLQRKPGRFHLERCGGCGTVFQNPRLTVDGLGFYYRDFYDGIGQERFEVVFTAEAPSYVGRIDLVGRYAEPRRWLDVGTGHGHFCLVARERWPKAAIDGLDMTDAIEEAERRGWVGTGYRGLFPELAPSLAGAYDVVSMHHYLEHTREPGADLDAAAVVLEAGGFLEIEVPNPESRFGRWLGTRWVPYFQPQHQHLIPVGTLCRMLAERGFTVVDVELAAAHQKVDLLFAAGLSVLDVLPQADVPWAPAPGPARRIARNAGLVATAPALALAAGLDQVVAPALRRWSPNTYRVLARYDGSPATAP